MAIGLDDVLKTVVTLTMPGTTVAQNVFYSQLTSSGGESDVDVIEAQRLWVEDMYDNILGEVSDLVAINEISVYVQVSEVPIDFDLVGIVDGTGVGSEVGHPLPNGVALVIRAATIVAGTVARKYIPGLSEVSSEGAAWTAAVLIDAVGFGVDWVTGPDTYLGATYEGGVVSSKDGKFKPFSVAALISTIPGYQRRRKPGVGV